jgi:regulator of nonsense transcripts 1
MADPFAQIGNHLVSNSAKAINAGADDLDRLEPDSTLLGLKAGGSRIRADDDDNQREVKDDDDNDSTESATDGMSGMKLKGPREDKQLPAHACA